MVDRPSDKLLGVLTGKHNRINCSHFFLCWMVKSEPGSFLVPSCFFRVGNSIAQNPVRLPRVAFLTSDNKVGVIVGAAAHYWGSMVNM